MSRGDLIEAARRNTKPRMIEARYHGHCKWCEEPIVVGRIVAYSSQPNARYCVHSGCYAEMWLGAHEGVA